MPSSMIMRVALPTPLKRLFDYLPPQGIDCNNIAIGARVRVPFQSRVLTGIFIAAADQTAVAPGKLKMALEILDGSPLLPPELYRLCQWAAEYYHASLGEVLCSALPTLLRQGKPAISTKKTTFTGAANEEKLLLNQEQQQAVQRICAIKNKFTPYLLEGITGSGKTEVYLQAMADFLQAGKQVLVLVPEISLTPQTIARFRARFSLPIAALHSGLSEGARLQAWLAARSGEVRIVIGTRSAIFTPFAELGLIIVDEEHDTSFKQQDRFRYHARDVAIMRANLNSIPIVLGSATPSLESLLNVKRQRYEHLVLTERAGKATCPQYQIVDLRQNPVEEGISLPLLDLMRSHLDQGNQVMLFLNRRGFAPILYCLRCAWSASCKRCDTRLVFHHAPRNLQCHHCDARRPVPRCCEACGATELQPVGLGTERLEQTLLSHFPGIPLIRVDRDNTRRKGALDQLLDQIHAEPKAILLGTQMLAKGHHFVGVTLVGVVDADSGLFSADFRAAEQMGQLLMQVSGRAGRGEKPGMVVIQTKHPEHPLLQSLIQHGYASFARLLLKEREESLLPPFSHFAVFRAEAYAEAQASRFLNMIKDKGAAFSEAVTLLGPVPALLPKRKGLHCQHLLVKAQDRRTLQHFLKNMLHQIDKLSGRAVAKWTLDVDPLEV